MATTVACRECGDSFTISPEHLGRKYRCKSCGTVNVAEESKPSGDRKKKSSADATRRKPPQKTSQQRAAGASQKPRKPQKKRRPKSAPEPTYDEYSYDYDEAEYESYETYEDYDAVEEYQPSRSRSRRSTGKKKKRSSSGVSLPSIPWKKIGGLVGTALLVLIIGGRVLRVVLNVGRAIGTAQTGDVGMSEQVPDNGGFRILMPTSPVYETEQIPLDGANRFTTSESWVSISLRTGVVVGVTRVPRPQAPGLSDEQFLESIADGAREDLTDEGLTVDRTSSSRLADRYALMWEFSDPDMRAGIGVKKLTVDPQWMWQVTVIAQDSSVFPVSRTEEIFNSFQIPGITEHFPDAGERPTPTSDRGEDQVQDSATAAAVEVMRKAQEEAEERLRSKP